MHGSSLAMGSLERAQQLPRPATLPRPISTDNLGRVASLAYGIPGVRTRAQVGLGDQGVTVPGPGMGHFTGEQQGKPGPALHYRIPVLRVSLLLTGSVHTALGEPSRAVCDCPSAAAGGGASRSFYP